ncbi:MAG: tRNA glutamyl-Q(34) synthetase GluQRS [Acidimicrobiales bacterium]|jgi:glutamyl-tRNA synthetase|nr:tRNA glutamyl-Q(34) synthetase GluQRS [Acidimicrobiales bacterium]
MADGRFAPSPTGALHLGNLRTALLAWLFARSDGSRFLLRVEDLDPSASRREHERAHQHDLAALGLDWDGPVLRQSERFALYHEAIDVLVEAGRTYHCYCTRREIAEAASAPHDHLPEGAYPGTCRTLARAQRAAREAEGRRPALRLRAGGVTVGLVDRLCGPYEGYVDDFVIRRNDGAPAYNLAVVVDDAAQRIGEVVRGDDLLATTPRQLFLAGVLDLPAPGYAHVPLVLGPDGQRLAKRHGAVTLAERVAHGDTPDAVRAALAVGLGLAEPGEEPSPATLLERFDPDALPRTPWVLPEALAA